MTFPVDVPVLATLQGAQGLTGVLANLEVELLPWDAEPYAEMTGPEEYRGAVIHLPMPTTPESINNDDATQQLILTPTKTRDALEAETIRVASSLIRLDGERAMFGGDSITLLGTTLTQGQSYTTFGPWQSGGRVREFHRIAVSGQRSDQLLAGIRAFIAAGGPMPTMASILIGTNDRGQGVPIEQWQANVTAIFDELRAVGCEPIALTLPPRSGPATPVPPEILNGVWNAWLRQHTTAKNILTVDIWKVVSDPATGEWRTGWANPVDGVHPTAVAQKAMGDEWIRVVGPHLKSAPFPQLDGYSSVGAREAGGTFAGPAGSAIPAGLTVTGSGSATIVQDAASPTKFALRLTAANPAVRPDVMTKALKSAGDFKTGDVIEVVEKFRIVAATVAAGFGIRTSIVEYSGGVTSTQHPVWMFGQSTPTSDYLTPRYRFTPAASTDEIRVTFQYLKDTSGADNIEALLALLRIYNVTALGLA